MPQEQNIITSLVELTRLRDQQAIRHKLLSSLLEISDAAWLVLCRLEQKQDDAVIEVCQRMPNPAPDKAVRHFPRALFDRGELFQRCIDSGMPVWVQDLDGYQGIIFQLPGSGPPHDFVVLFDERVDGRSERIVGSVLDLYDNFISLVIENTQDPLTRLLNRGAFDIDLPAALLRLNAAEAEADASAGAYLAMMDLDHFKRINDTFGHLYGDEVILLFASLLREVLGEHGRVYRYGGEEFAAIVEGITPRRMTELLERLRQTVEDHEFPQVGQVTVSIGWTELCSNQLPSSLLDAADQALYRAKAEGRNRLCFHDPREQVAGSGPSAESDTDDIFF